MLKMQSKLPFNFLKLLILMGLLIIEGPFISSAFAQQDNPADVPQEEHDTQDLEKLLKNYNKDQEKVLNDTSKLHNIQDSDNAKSEVSDAEFEEVTTEVTGKPSEESVKKFLDSTHAKNKEKILPSDLSSSVAMALEPMQQLSEKELLKRLDEATKDSSARPYMDQFPNITIFAVRLIKDKESIPSAVKILEDRERLIHFAGVMLCTILFGFLLKRVMHREGRSFIKAVLFFFLRVYIMFAIRIGVVYYFYSNELAPAARVFKKTFM